MNKKGILCTIIILTLMVSVTAISGCVTDSKQHRFFCGAVEVTVEKHMAGEDDSVKITFCEPGNYTVKFEPDKFDGCCDCDGHVFKITKDDVCCYGVTKTFSTYRIPSDFTVIIHKDRDCESYCFD